MYRIYRRKYLFIRRKLIRLIKQYGKEKKLNSGKSKAITDIYGSGWHKGKAYEDGEHADDLQLILDTAKAL